MNGGARGERSPRIDADVDFAAMVTAFEEARSSPAAVVERWYVLAREPVRVRVVGACLAERVLAPFEHLRRASSARASLSIDLWDESESGVSCEACVAHDDLIGEGTFGATPDGRFVMHAMAQTKSVFDRSDGRIVGWVGTFDRLTLYELGRPLHSQLMLWHRDRGMQAVHAGFVARADDGLLFGGPGGAGKSTVALTCHKAGFDYLGDDYIALEHRPAGWRGHSLYSSTHVDPLHLERFPHLVPFAVRPRLEIEDKAVVMMARAAPDRLVSSAAVRAVALPRVTGRPRTVVRPASRVEALLRLAPSSLLMLPHAGLNSDEFERLSTFLESVPVYWLELGSDLEEIPDRVAQILDETGHNGVGARIEERMEVT